MHLTAITHEKGNLEAFLSLRKNLLRDARGPWKRGIGWQGGSNEFDTYYLRAHDLWAVLEKSAGDGDRFWNCFGFGDPEEWTLKAPIVEINPPHTAGSGNIQGLFARDDTGHTYVAHGGRVNVTGGGIGRIETLPTFEQQLIGKRLMWIIGDVDSPDLPEKIARFVGEVARLKSR